MAYGGLTSFLLVYLFTYISLDGSKGEKRDEKLHIRLPLFSLNSRMRHANTAR